MYKCSPHKIELGGIYEVSYVLDNGFGLKSVCKFIQPTRCGFNFLNLDTHKCILKRHLYRSKHDNHKDGNWFFIGGPFRIREITKEEVKLYK